MEHNEKIINIRRHILENAIQMHENVITTLRQEIYNLDDMKPERNNY